jgi:hypothetical protein
MSFKNIWILSVMKNKFTWKDLNVHNKIFDSLGFFRRLFKEPEVTPAEELDLKWEKPDEEGLVSFDILFFFPEYNFALTLSFQLSLSWLFTLVQN